MRIKHLAVMLSPGDTLIASDAKDGRKFTIEIDPGKGIYLGNEHEEFFYEFSKSKHGGVKMIGRQL